MSNGRIQACSLSHGSSFGKRIGWRLVFTSSYPIDTKPTLERHATLWYDEPDLICVTILQPTFYRPTCTTCTASMADSFTIDQFGKSQCTWMSR